MEPVYLSKGNYVSYAMDEYKDLEMPLQFYCEACGGEMYPEYFKNVYG
jgi:hypothetical protein